ncbi:MAG: hypothetical protein QXQ14_01435 [Candidatus Aenigmatarchaeota archaeon]
MREVWLVHAILHFLVPIIVIFNYIIFFKEIKIENIIAILIGSFIPDIDHVAYYKFAPKNFLKFLKFNITSDRIRRGFLIFHNLPFLAFWSILTPITALYSINLFLFFLSFLLHLILDYLDDKFVLGYTYHWRRGKGI